MSVSDTHAVHESDSPRPRPGAAAGRVVPAQLTAEHADVSLTANARDPRGGPDQALRRDAGARLAWTCRSSRARCTATSGPNGAGKTTTIRLLLGLHRPTAGRARAVRRRRVERPRAGAPAGGLRRRRAVPVAVADRRRDARVPGAACTAAPTWPTATSWSSGSSSTPRKKVRALSKGNRQKVQLVAALATRADLLLLDEPTSGLDPLMEMVFRDCVTEAKERGQTSSCPRTSSARSRRSATGSASCGTGGWSTRERWRSCAT